MFDSTALVKTKKGYHVYLKRSAYADAKQLYDGPVGFTWSAEKQKVVKKEVDLKTLTASTSVILDANGCTTRLAFSARLLRRVSLGCAAYSTGRRSTFLTRSWTAYWRSAPSPAASLGRRAS
jgi:hypothetical protein